MKKDPKTRMFNAVSAEAVRIPNGNNHHLLKFALMCSLLETRSRLRRLVSILFVSYSGRYSCIERCFTLLRTRRAISYAYSGPASKGNGTVGDYGRPS